MTLPPAVITAAWTPVADRVPNTPGRDRWAWRITQQERAMLTDALAAGTALMAHRRDPSGAWALLARRCGGCAEAHRLKWSPT